MYIHNKYAQYIYILCKQKLLFWNRLTALNISQYYSFYCIYDQINAALISQSVTESFKTILKITNFWPLIYKRRYLAECSRCFFKSHIFRCSANFNGNPHNLEFAPEDEIFPHTDFATVLSWTCWFAVLTNRKLLSLKVSCVRCASYMHYWQ